MRQSISIVKQVIRDIPPGLHSPRVPPIIKMKSGGVCKDRVSDG